MKIRYGTRGSALALAQSDGLAARLKGFHPPLELERVVIKTSGDEGKKPEPGENVKAMFVKEIEEALLSGSIDFAVHSSKDLPGELPQGLEITAYPVREDARDVYIGGPQAPRWENIGVGAAIGTSSLRRQIQLRLINPGITFVPMSGNVDTRLQRLQEGKASGLVLAKAGLKRLGRDGVPHQELSIETVVPAPGQGALAVEARSDRKEVRDILAPLDDAKTRVEVECERLFLKAMGGGCSTPLGAYAEAAADRRSVKLSIFWSDAQALTPIRRSGSCSTDPERMKAFVDDMASQVRRSSGDSRP